MNRFSNWRLPPIDPIAEARRILHMHFSKWTKGTEWSLRKYTERFYSVDFTKVLQERPYLLVYMEGGDEYYDFFAIVYSKLLERTFVLISSSLRESIRVEHFLLPKPVDVINPKFDPKEDIIHMLHFLIRFRTQDHSIVYRDQSYLVAKPELEQALWLSWQGKLHAKEPSLPERLPNRVDVNKVRSFFAMNAKSLISEDSRKGTIIVIRTPEGSHISVYDSVKNVTYGDDQLDAIQSFLKEWYLGPYGSSWFPVFCISKKELTERILGSYEALIKTFFLFHFEIPFGDPRVNLRQSLRGRIEPALRRYMEGKRDLLCNIPESYEEVVPILQPFLYKYGIEENGFCYDLLSEDEEHMDIRKVSVLCGIFDTMMPKFFHILFSTEGNLEQSIDILEKEQDLTNDGPLLFCMCRHVFQANESWDHLAAWARTYVIEADDSHRWTELIGRTVETPFGNCVVLEQLKSRTVQNTSFCTVKLPDQDEDDTTTVKCKYMAPSRQWNGSADELKGWISTLEPGENVYIRNIKKYGTFVSPNGVIEFLRYRMAQVDDPKRMRIWEIDSQIYSGLVHSKRIVASSAEEIK